MKFTLLVLLVFAFIGCDSNDNPPPVANNPITLTGENLVGGVLTANIGEGAGVGTPAITINEAAGNTYTITFGDVGKKIKVVATYSNGSVEYTMPDAVGAPTLTISITPENESDFADEKLIMTATPGNVGNSFVNPGITYSWKDGDAVIAGANTDTLTIGSDRVGRTITGAANFTGYSYGGSDTYTPTAYEMFNGTIPVYLMSGVVDKDTAINNLNSRLDGSYNSEERAIIVANIGKIIIVPGTNECDIATQENGKYVARIGETATGVRISNTIINPILENPLIVSANARGSVRMASKSKNTLGEYLATKWDQNRGQVIMKILFC